MRLLVIMGRVVVLTFLLAACTTKAQDANPTVVYNTPGPLNKTALYWDMGLSIQYPDNWIAPIYTDGQMLLLTSAASMRGQTPIEPIVAVRIIDPSRDLRLLKSATLEQIASALSAGRGGQIGDKGSVEVAGLDASYINVTDANTQLVAQTVAFRLPDGRTGALIGVAPVSLWTYFAPSFDRMRVGATLLKPAAFKSPEIGTDVASLPQAGITFALPKGWVEKIAGDARIYRDSSAIAYADPSDFTNGPQLVMIAQAMPKETTLQTALTNIANLRASDKVIGVNIGNQAGLLASYPDAMSGHIVTFVAFASQDRSVLIICRWTTPGILVEAAAPTLGAVLQSVKFGAITVTVIPGPTATPNRRTRAAPAATAAR